MQICSEGLLGASAPAQAVLSRYVATRFLDKLLSCSTALNTGGQLELVKASDTVLICAMHKEYDLN